MSNNLELLKEELENFSNKVATVEINEDFLELKGIKEIHNQLAPLEISKTRSSMQIIKGFANLVDLTTQDKYTFESRNELAKSIKIAQSLLCPGAKPTKRDKDEIIGRVKIAHDGLKEIAQPTLYKKSKCWLDLLSNIRLDYRKFKTVSKNDTNLSEWQISFEEHKGVTRKITLWNMTLHNSEKGNILSEDVYMKIVSTLTHDEGVPLTYA